MRTLRLLLGSVVVYVVVAACGGGSSGTSGIASEDGGILDALANPVGDARADGAISGSRLKAKRYVGDDGSQQFVGWFDSARNEDCAFMTASDGRVRCLPGVFTSSAGLFSDSACATPIIIQMHGCAPPTYAIVPTTNVAANCSDSKHMVVGVKQTTDPVYSLASGTCATVSTSPSLDYFTVGAEVPPSSFAGGQLQTDP